MVKTSFIWKYFITIRPQVAQCIECKAEFSYKGGPTSNLIRHMRKHPNVYVETSIKIEKQNSYFEDGYSMVHQVQGAESSVNVQSSGVEVESPINQVFESFSNEGNRRSVFWKYFLIVSPGRAKCITCSGEFSFKGGSTTNLLTHLRNKHPSIIENQDHQGENSSILQTTPCTTQENTEIGSQVCLSDDRNQSFSGIANDSNPLRLTKRTNKRSNIWNFFLNNGSNLMECLICHNQISSSCGSTTNLARHLKRRHPSTYWEPIKKTFNPPTSKTSTPKNTEHENQPKPLVFVHKPISLTTAKQIDQQLIHMIVKNHYPLNIVENEEFKNMVHLLNPCYRMPPPQTIADTLLELYHEKCCMVREGLSNVKYIAIVINGWTSCNEQHFRAFTAHFINSESELQTYFLGCKSFHEEYTPQHLYNIVLDLLEEWEITEKICCTVDDNSNEEMNIGLISSDRLSCFAYNVNVIVQTALIEINEVHRKIKATVHYFNNSSYAKESLTNHQNQADCPQIKLQQDVSTTWNSTYEMFDAVLKIKNPLLSATTEVAADLGLTENDFNILESCCKMLKPFQDISLEMNTNSITISKVILFCNGVRAYLDKIKSIESPFAEVNAMYNVLSCEFNNRLGDVEDNKIYTEATFLDPRFKNEGFSMVETDEKVMQSLICYIAHEISQVSMDHSYSCQETSEEVTDNNIWSDFDKQVKTIKLEKTPESLAKEEINLYLRDPLLGRKEDPLKWWADRKYYYPHLYERMKSVLCIPATSLPSHRFASDHAESATERIKQLESDEVNTMLFLNFNM